MKKIDIAKKTSMIKIRYFAQAREASGMKEEILHFEDGMLLNDIINEIKEEHPKVSGISPLMVLVNGIITETDRRVANGDVLAILPPVGGG